MENFENNIENNIENNAVKNLPSQVSIWSKIRNFLFQDITIKLTPKQRKVLKEVHDFWHQELNHDFWFQEIKIIDNIKL